MTTNEVTSTGLTTQPLTEITTDLENDFKAIYGSDINLASNTPDGQMIGIMAQLKRDLLDVVTDVYNSFDPDAALGVPLDQRVAINGIQRIGGTYTITDVSITTDRAMNLDGIGGTAPFTVADGAGNQFQLVTTLAVSGAGTYSEPFQAVEIGAIQTQLNTITNQVTVVVGVTAVNNPTAASVLGLDEESDADLKLRRQSSLAIGSRSSVDSMYSYLANIATVSDALVWENFKASSQLFTGLTTGETPADGATLVQATSGATATVSDISADGQYLEITDVSGTFDTTHVVTGTNPSTNTFTFTPAALVIEPNSIWAIVEGGTDAAIGAVIYAQKSAGCNMNGVETVNVVRPNGDVFVAQFDRPDYVALQIHFYLTAKVSGASYTAGDVTAALAAALTYNLYEGADSASIVEALATIVPYFSPTGVEISEDGGSNWAEIVNPDSPNKKYTIAAADITIL